MRKILPIILTLTIIVLSSCGPVATASTEGTALPTFPPVVPTDVPASADTPTPQRIPPDGTLSPISDKSSLVFDPAPAFPISTVIGFILPDGRTAIKAAPKTIIADAPDGPDGLTIVGAVELGSAADNATSGLYTVVIDLASVENQVTGRLIPSLGDFIPQNFNRVPLSVNPNRVSDLPDPGVSIASNTVCFFTGLGDPKEYFRYCAIPGENLSVSSRFSKDYEILQNDIRKYAENINLLDGLMTDSTISELEDSAHIKECDQPNNCKADRLGVPLESFDADYKAALESSVGEKFAVAAGMLHVFREMKIDETVIQAGDYRVDFFFYPDETFLGATLTGKTDKGDEIIDQQIPASEAAYLSDDSNEIPSQISAWKIKKKCVLQKKCP